MAYDLGQVRGSISIDIAQAVAAYAALRRANAATDTALLESSRALRTVGAGLVGIGAVALAGFGVAVKAASDFQAKMRYFQVITGSSKKDMDAATTAAFNLAKQSGYTAGQIADAFVELGKAGINAHDIVQGVGAAVAQLGAAAQIGTKDAAEIIVNTMKTFQIGAKGATGIANLLAGAANASTVDIQDLAYSLKYVGGTAQAIGIPLSDVVNALGQLGNAGVRGSTGGTALRKILLSLAPVSKQATAELEKLGIIQTNGGVSADQYAKAQAKQKTAIDALRKAQEHLVYVQQLQNAEQAKSSTASVEKQQAAANSLAAAQQRLAAAQDHLQATQQKYAGGGLANTAAKQATMFNSLASAQNRVKSAQLALASAEEKVKAAQSGGTSASTQIRAAEQLKLAQEAVAAAAAKARAAGVTVAPGIEKLTNLFFDATGKAKPLSEIFQILQDHMKGMSQQQKVTALNIIFGNRAISSALILSREGAKGFQEFGKQMNQTTAADVMRKRLDTLSGAWKQFKAAMSVALIQAGAPAQTPLKILVHLITDVVKVFTDLPGPVQAVLSGLVLLFGAITGGLGAFILMVSFIGKATRAYREFKMALIFVKEVQLLQRAFALLNITMLANPIILIVVAIIALIAVFAILIIKVKPVREFFIALGKDIVGAFQAVVRWFEGLPKFFEKVWSDIKGLFWDGVHLIEKYWWLLPGIFLGPFAGIVAIIIHFRSQIWNALKAVVSGAIRLIVALPGALASGFVAFLKFLAGLPDQVLYWLGFLIGRILRWTLELISLIVSTGIRFVAAVINFFTALPARVEHLMTALKNGVVRLWNETWNGTIRIVKSMYNGVVGFFEKLPGRVWSALQTLWKREVQGWKNIYNTAVQWAKDAFWGVVHFFEKLPGQIWNFLQQIWKDAVNLGKTIVQAMTQWGSDAFNGIMNFFNNLPDAIYNALLNAIKSIGHLAQKAFDTAKHWGSSLWNGFKKGLFGSPRTKIEYALEDMTATADRETKKLAQQVRYLNGLATKLPNGQLLSQSTGAHRAPTAPTPGVAGSAGTPSKQYDIIVNYPKPEPASEGIERTLNNLEFVGA